MLTRHWARIWDNVDQVLDQLMTRFYAVVVAGQLRNGQNQAGAPCTHSCVFLQTSLRHDTNPASRPTKFATGNQPDSCSETAKTHCRNGRKQITFLLIGPLKWITRDHRDSAIICISTNRVQTYWCLSVARDSGGLRELRESYRIDFHPSCYL